MESCTSVIPHLNVILIMKQSHFFKTLLMLFQYQIQNNIIINKMKLKVLKLCKISITLIYNA